MDTKQFELLQATMQWVADEAKHERVTEWRWQQSMYGVGLASKSVTGVDGFGYRVECRTVCATAACAAGNAVLIHGDEFIVKAGPAAIGQIVAVNQCIDSEGNVHNISERAAKLMGLTGIDARRMFDGENSAATVLHHGRLIAHRNGYKLEVIE